MDKETKPMLMSLCSKLAPLFAKYVHYTIIRDYNNARLRSAQIM